MLRVRSSRRRRDGCCGPHGDDGCRLASVARQFLGGAGAAQSAWLAPPEPFVRMRGSAIRSAAAIRRFNVPTIGRVTVTGDVAVVWVEAELEISAKRIK